MSLSNFPLSYFFYFPFYSSKSPPLTSHFSTTPFPTFFLLYFLLYSFPHLTSPFPYFPFTAITFSTLLTRTILLALPLLPSLASLTCNYFPYFLSQFTLISYTYPPIISPPFLYFPLPSSLLIFIRLTHFPSSYIPSLSPLLLISSYFPEYPSPHFITLSLLSLPSFSLLPNLTFSLASPTASPLISTHFPYYPFSHFHSLLTLPHPHFPSTPSFPHTNEISRDFKGFLTISKDLKLYFKGFLEKYRK